MQQTHLSIRNASKIYKKDKAVDSVNLDVEKGKFLTILGPSGSGKTTLLKMVAGFEKLTEGTILLNNMDISEKMPFERDIGMVFQNYALFPHMTVRQNIAYPLRIRKMDKKTIQTKIRDIVELVNLTGFEERNSKQLSGGQQQRVALARAIVFNPPLLLLDEPLGALDKNLREKMQIEIRRIQKDTGITTINVTHDQAEALTMSDLICVMNEGKIEQVATPEELYEHPANKFVANFIGEVNLFEGDIVSRGNNGTVVKLSKEPDKVFNVNEVKKIDSNKVYLVLRPENIHLVEEVNEYENFLKVTVMEKVYGGDAIKVKAKTSFDQEVFIKFPVRLNNQIEIDSEITIGWDVHHSTLIAYE
ncbi:ABC transporter ATP-binding protein [Neobacillus sp. 19]|uniref:ABC transporter ATP-binding protein n=1 Tax=Neobacillus sp. 19 TaxID=3394458 RepID=UPI003BF64385